MAIDTTIVDSWRGKGNDEREVTGKLFKQGASRALLVELMSPRKKALFFTLTLAVLHSAMTMAVPYLVKVGIDKGIPALIDHNSALPISLTLIALIVVALLQAGFDYATSIAIGKLGQDSLFDLRKRVFGHVMELGVAFHERFTSGRVIARLTSDMEAIDHLLSVGLRQLLWAFLTVVTAFAMLFVLDVQLALVVSAFMPFVVLVTYWFRRESFSAYQQMRDRVALVIIHFVESLRGVAAVQLFRREPRNEELFSILNESYRQSKQRTTRLIAVYGPGVRVIGNISMALVLLIGGWKVLDGDITVGVLAAFILYLRRMIEPVMDMSYFYNSFQAAAAALEKIANLLQEKPRIPNPTNPVVLVDPRGEILFENVQFGYGHTASGSVLRDFDLHIPAGQTVALVGATGAGKSTIVKLLARLYDPVEGRVMFDGVDLKSVQLSSLRTHIAMVTQENFLFSESVSNNIAFGNPEVSQDEIETAARAIGAHDFIMSLPDGYETHIGKRGAELSTGQRQLISFARAFLANPRVLLLDEATSSLDIPSERLVQRALQVLLADRTAIIIAHRLSTIEIAHRVLVLEHGQIVEDGTPTELTKAELTDSSGHFRRLHNAWRDSLT